MVLIAVGATQLLLAATAVVSIAGAIGYAAYRTVYTTSLAEERLEALTVAAETGGTDQRRDEIAVAKLAARFGKLAQSGGDVSEAEKIKATLLHAGYRSRRAPDIFGGLRFFGVLGMPVFCSPSVFFVSMPVALLIMTLGAAMGYYAPLIVLSSQASSRQRELMRAFPDALDLLVSGIESGLSLDQAFRRTAMEMANFSPTLSREFTLVTSEVSAGVERAKALTHLSERTGLPDISSFVSTLIQAERYGSSIGASLRMFSGITREKRMSRAEETAGGAGNRMTIVMILFFLPVLAVVLLGPTAIRIMSEM